jgi:hypothetical protein
MKQLSWNRVSLIGAPTRIRTSDSLIGVSDSSTGVSGRPTGETAQPEGTDRPSHLRRQRAAR